jgi:post-segregation antitoxin (ccd killing protein)
MTISAMQRDAEKKSPEQWLEETAPKKRATCSSYFSDMRQVN